ncbi:MAG: TetR/AcrR family transcriptional regulator [Acidimicrobiales bacterium]
MGRAMVVVEGGEPIDGRSLRAVRTRQLIVESCLDLVDEGETQPTALQVSERSGVSMSTVFRLFSDVEALHASAIATQLERVTPLIVDLPADGSVEERVRRLVDSRAKLFEAITPVRRLAIRLAVSSRPIREDLEFANRFFRAQVVDLLSTELGSGDAGRDVLDAVDAMTSWDVWERFRGGQGLSVRRTKATVTMLVLGVVVD